MAAGPVTLPVPQPKAGGHGDEPLAARVVLVREVGTPPPGVSPVEWALLTNVPTATFAGADARAAWYARRRLVEEFHKALKTACGVELPQRTGVARLEPMIAPLSVVPLFRLTPRDAARTTTAAQFLPAVARLGGHPSRGSDGPPGGLTLWCRCMT